MSDDDAKRTILARRARFIAAAVASVGIACGKTETFPGPCLSVAVEHDAATVPMPCLSVPQPQDARIAEDAAADADAGEEAGVGASTTVNDGGVKKLQPVPKPTGPVPMPCLSVKPASQEPRKR